MLIEGVGSREHPLGERSVHVSEAVSILADQSAVSEGLSLCAGRSVHQKQRDETVV